jgi:RNA polymerase sigma factor (sigma-70 family)
MNQLSDAELIERIGRGDQEATGELYRRYWRAARAAAYGVTADLASAEDAAAEGLQSALVNLRELKSAEKLGPWLRTIVVRAARRQRTRHSYWAELDTLADGGSRGDDMERRETAALVHEAVNRLSRLFREAVCLHYFEGYSVSDAAGFLGVPEGTVKRRLHEARQRLAHTCIVIPRIIQEVGNLWAFWSL